MFQSPCLRVILKHAILACIQLRLQHGWCMRLTAGHCPGPISVPWKQHLSLSDVSELPVQPYKPCTSLKGKHEWKPDDPYMLQQRPTLASIISATAPKRVINNWPKEHHMSLLLVVKFFLSDELREFRSVWSTQDNLQIKSQGMT